MTASDARPMIVRWIFVLLATFAVQACSDESSPTDGGQTPNPDAAQLSVFLTDAPGDVDAVWVQVNDVVLVGGEGGQVSLLDAPTELIKLTDLTDSAEELAASVEVPPGTYTQARFLLGGAVLQSGQQVYTMGGASHPEGMEATGDLMCPSCAQTGVKVKLGRSLDLSGGLQASMLLDFDVSQSFGRQAGRSGMWVMSPVIHGTLDDDGDDDGDGEPDPEGEIEGTVVLGSGVEIPTCGDAPRSLEELVVTATAATATDDEGEPLVFSGVVEEDDGAFTFEIETSVLDDFALGVRSETTFDGGTLTWEAEADPAQVTLDAESDEVEDVVYTVTSASCEPAGTDGGEPSPDHATVDVFLKDAPGGIDAVWVQVDDVVLVGGPGGKVSLLDAPTELIKLSDLTESSEQLAEGVEVDVGSYQQIRFVLGGAVLQAGDEVLTMGGAEHPEGMEATGDLKCPSCGQSGFKVKLGKELDLEGGLEALLLLDFDISQSFLRQAGNSGKWIVKPVIHASVDDDGDGDGEPEPEGEIKGSVALGTDGEGEPLEVPACGGGERSLADLVPTATAATATDDEGEPLVFSGLVSGGDDGFSFKIETSVHDAFDLGVRAETAFDGEKLVWEAEADPAQVTLDGENPEAEGVAYTVTGVSCEAVAP